MMQNIFSPLLLLLLDKIVSLNLMGNQKKENSWWWIIEKNWSYSLLTRNQTNKTKQNKQKKIRNLNHFQWKNKRYVKERMWKKSKEFWFVKKTKRIPLTNKKNSLSFFDEEI